MHSLRHPFRLGALAAALVLAAPALAQSEAAAEDAVRLDTVTVNASADASAEGLAPAYAGNQVARGGRVGVLGNRDAMDTPFNATAYTSELMQDQQAKSVSDVMQNDASVRTARGFGNFQELYVIRGFPVFSDDMAYNGLYGLLPRQYVAAELLERVEVLRGANTFINGAAPGGSGIGGSVNLLPKRAPNDPLNRLTVGVESGAQGYVAADVGRRFGDDGENGIRINAARRDGGTAIDDERRRLDVLAVGLDHRGSNFRLSADIGHQDHDIDEPRPSVTPTGAAPSAPDASNNFAQPWTFSKERQTFATFRGEFDLTDDVTAWAAAGVRDGDEKNRLANPRAMSDGSTTAYRFDNVREDAVSTGEIGIRGRLITGAVSHEVVASANIFRMSSRNAYAFSDFAGFASDLNDPGDVAPPDADFFTGGSMSSPHVTERTNTRSVALADTMGFLDDRLLVTVGARHQTIAQRGYNYNTGAKESDYDKSEVTPMAGVVFKLNPQVSLYANYAEALVKGDIAPAVSGGQPIDNAGEVLAPYVSKQKEAGVKYDGGRLGGSLAFFTTDKPFTTVENGVFGANGEQRNRGIELTVFGQPLHNLRVLGGLTLLDAQLKKTAGGALDGNDAIGVPDSQLNLGVEWDVPGMPGLTLTGRAIHTSKQYIDEANDERIPSWTRFDVGARYITDIGGQVMTLRARIENLADRDYWASAGGYPGANYLVLGAPRTFTLTASFDF
ncbi:TonB-dependent receptor [Pseudazoarcus pumilus]|uniref:TonB-dependent siderophore receptor n=1 Tax=Pseudazoarcus pumilus TaxID=2067960 RepID=A0A2I6S2G3_9RHOO|nr:TonB-dependent siderophore receptor [Pseudazoarcus pumilus]AUN93460.1 TonB-dependent siderophore receptor [Pseudazoarcus pumilus]